MKNIKYVLFDLDGTLTDPGEGITNSVAYALEKFGITVTDRKELYKFIGPPLIDSFMEYYGFDKQKAETALKYYREYFGTKGIYENAVYAGIPQLLEGLCKKGIRVVLATSKPEKFAKEILSYFGLDKYFYFIAGATMDETRNKKPDVIRYALDSCNLTDMSTAVMVGDRSFDIEGAHINGVRAIGVAYGYGSLSELSKAGADYIAETVEQLVNIFLG